MDVLRRFLPQHMLRSYDNLRNYGFMLVIGIIMLIRFTPFGDVIGRIIYATVAPYQGISSAIQSLILLTA